MPLAGLAWEAGLSIALRLYRISGLNVFSVSALPRPVFCDALLAPRVGCYGWPDRIGGPTRLRVEGKQLGTTLVGEMEFKPPFWAVDPNPSYQT